jgi:hypothetical protein
VLEDRAVDRRERNARRRWRAVDVRALTRGLTMLAPATALGWVAGATDQGEGPAQLAVVTIAATAVALRAAATAGAARRAGQALAAGAVVVAVASALAERDAGSLLPLVAVLVWITFGAASLRRLVTGGGGADAARWPVTLDDFAQRELARARRSEVPLTVVTVAFAGGRPGSAPDGMDGPLDVGARVATVLRTTDVVGHLAGGRLVALLADTGVDQREDAIARLCAGFTSAELDRLRLGWASFPHENTTWRGLLELAREREAPPWAFRPSAALGQRA